MIRRVGTFIAPLLFAAALPANAGSINLTFESFISYSQVGDYYNGGRDSHNRKGGNDYGLSFTSEYIQHTPRGAFLAGPVELTIDPAKLRAALGSDKYYISFNAARYDVDGGGVDVVFEDGFYEPYTWVSGNGNPNCPWNPMFCGVPHLGTMDGYYVYSAYGEAMATKIRFNTNRLDNLQFHAYTESGFIVPDRIVASDEFDRVIPEPASMALLGIGVLGLLIRRRRASQTDRNE